jgi:hypothetical protein
VWNDELTKIFVSIDAHSQDTAILRILAGNDLLKTLLGSNDFISSKPRGRLGRRVKVLVESKKIWHLRSAAAIRRF